MNNREIDTKRRCLTHSRDVHVSIHLLRRIGLKCCVCHCSHTSMGQEQNTASSEWHKHSPRNWVNVTPIYSMSCRTLDQHSHKRLVTRLNNDWKRNVVACWTTKRPGFSVPSLVSSASPSSSSLDPFHSRTTTMTKTHSSQCCPRLHLQPHPWMCRHCQKLRHSLFVPSGAEDCAGEQSSRRGCGVQHSLAVRRQVSGGLGNLRTKEAVGGEHLISSDLVLTQKQPPPTRCRSKLEQPLLPEPKRPWTELEHLGRQTRERGRLRASVCAQPASALYGSWRPVLAALLVLPKMASHQQEGSSPRKSLWTGNFGSWQLVWAPSPSLACPCAASS